MIKYYVCIINKIIYKINYHYYFCLEIKTYKIDKQDKKKSAPFLKALK